MSEPKASEPMWQRFLRREAAERSLVPPSATTPKRVTEPIVHQ